MDIKFCGGLCPSKTLCTYLGFASLGLSFSIFPLNRKREETLERGEAPLLPTLPLPLLREGGQGDRLPNNLLNF